MGRPLTNPCSTGRTRRFSCAAWVGEWLKTHVPRRRNTVRFLIPKSGSQNAFLGRDLIILARAIVKAEEWKKEDSEYGKFHSKYRRELQDILKVRFDRYAILGTWNYQEAKKCHFHIDNHGVAQAGGKTCSRQFKFR